MENVVLNVLKDILEMNGVKFVKNVILLVKLVLMDQKKINVLHVKKL
jgi:hypothetical protein